MHSPVYLHAGSAVGVFSHFCRLVLTGWPLDFDDELQRMQGCSCGVSGPPWHSTLPGVNSTSPKEFQAEKMEDGSIVVFIDARLPEKSDQVMADLARTGSASFSN